MTTKEKAKELVERFKPYNQEYQEGTDGFYEDDLEGAKQCALICVDEILELDVAWYDEKLIKDYPRTYTADQSFEYWQEVKNEIEKL